MNAARTLLPPVEPDADAARRAPEHLRRAASVMNGAGRVRGHGSIVAPAPAAVARNVVVDFRDREAAEPDLVAGVRAIYRD